MTRKYLKLLNDEELQRIHQTSLDILENVGMVIDHEKALELLEGAGAKVDHKTKIAKFPPELVEKNLEIAPKTVIYAGRNPGNDMVLKAGGDIYVRGSGGETGYIDLKTGEYRRAKAADFKEWCILIDALPNINGCGPMSVEDVPSRTSDIHGALIQFENQRKHFVHPSFSVKNLRYVIEMMVAIRGSKEEAKSRPLFHPLVGTISPLYLNEDDVDMLFLACEYGLPVGIVNMPNVGVAVPATIAGALALGNAEVIAGITLAQVIKPGLPVTYMLEPIITDMTTGIGVCGAPENGLMLAALCQLGSELYKMPVETIGLFSDGVIPEQTMFQKASNALTAGLGGAALLLGVGTIELAMALSPVQLVIDNDIVGLLRRICCGFEINDDTLGLEAVKRVGPRGNFLTDPHTLNHIRTEFYRPSIFDRDSRLSWLAKGGKGLEQKAREKALTILEEHEVEPLDDAVVKELHSIVAQADKELANQ